MIKLTNLLIAIFLVATSIKTNAQSFYAPDTICMSDSIIIEYQGATGQTYYWNFCSGNLGFDPQGVSSNYSGQLDAPAFIDFAEENGIYYSFVTNSDAGTITRNNYGNSLLNEPTSENLGNFGGTLPLNLQGVQIVKDGTSWFVFVIGGQGVESRLVRLNFGNSLASTPTAVNLGNLGGLDYPVDLYVERIGIWRGFTVNKNTGTVTRFDFQDGIYTPPIAVNLGNPNNLLSSPCGIFPVKEFGKWFIFVSNSGSNNVARLDFGSDITSVPTGTSLGGEGVLVQPFDITIIKDCERSYGFVLNPSNDIVRLEFNDGLESQPEFVSLGDFGNLNGPRGISDVFRIGDTLQAFVTNLDNSTVTRMFFTGCDNATPSSSTQQTPPAIRYNSPGTYNISLVVNEGLPTQFNSCKNVVVLPNPIMSLGNDTVIDGGTTIVIGPDSAYYSHNWSTGSREQTIKVSNTGTYILKVSDEYGCSTTDQMDVIVDIGVPNFFTPNGDGYNDTWSIPLLYNVPEAEIWVYDRFGNTVAHYKAGDGEWDGTSNGRQLPAGTYWYIIKVPDTDIPYKGSVSIQYTMKLR